VLAMKLALINGIILGIGLVFPLGPQNTFIFRTGAIETKAIRICLIVLLAAVCDALLVLSAVLGSSWITHVKALKTLLVLVGILFLLYFAYKLWIDTISENSGEEQDSWGLAKQLLFCLSVSIINPHAIIDTFVVIGAVATEYSHSGKLWLASGCILADTIWFCSLAGVGFMIKKSKNNRMILKFINRLSALIMFYFAINLFWYFLNN
jgi:L-lysine exporter family protein LysE/ArgO